MQPLSWLRLGSASYLCPAVISFRAGFAVQLTEVTLQMKQSLVGDCASGCVFTLSLWSSTGWCRGRLCRLWGGSLCDVLGVGCRAHTSKERVLLLRTQCSVLLRCRLARILASDPICFSADVYRGHAWRKLQPRRLSDHIPRVCRGRRRGCKGTRGGMLDLQTAALAQCSPHLTPSFLLTLLLTICSWSLAANTECESPSCALELIAC